MVYAITYIYREHIRRYIIYAGRQKQQHIRGRHMLGE